MKKIWLCILPLLYGTTSDSQTYYWPAAPAVVTFNSCDSISLHLTGNFNNGCSYFYLPDNQTQIAGNDVYCHITARNNGCDSGWNCTMALVPVNGVYIFPSVNTSGNFNLHLVIHNKCMGNDNTDSLTIGAYTVSGFQANNVLSSNAGAAITPGTTVVYQLTTNIPANYTTYWYRNSSLANTAVNSTSWTTIIQTLSDTVNVKIVNDSICITEQDKWSNDVILNVTPNGINEPLQKTIHVYFEKSSNRIYLSNLKGNEQYTIFTVTGIKIMEGSFRNREETIRLDDRSSGIYVIRIFGKEGVSSFRF